MNNKKGFTLTELLLAVMIVGVIGIALAALTTASVRESGIGRTKAVLRGQLSLALRQLRQDILQSTEVTVSGNTLTLKQDFSLGPSHSGDTIRYIFKPGNLPGGGGGQTGGVIERNNEVWLGNVKSITDGDFRSPQFTLVQTLNDDIKGAIESRLRVRIIVEVPSDPVVNDVIDETFMLPHGFAIDRVVSGS